MSSLVMVMADPLSFEQSHLATGVRQGPTCGRFWRLGDYATGYAEVIPGPDRAITSGLSGPVKWFRLSLRRAFPEFSVVAACSKGRRRARRTRRHSALTSAAI